VIQGSPEWIAARVGRITGSRFSAVMAIGKQGQALKARRDLVETLVAERRTGQPEYVEDNPYMAHGRRCEPLARLAYEFETGRTVQQEGLIVHPEFAHIAFSPDGLIGDDGLWECKCPALEPRHRRTLETRRVPDEYLPQVQGGLWVCGRQWADYTSYYPSLPDGDGVVIVRVERDSGYIARLAAECAKVQAEVESRINQAA
jgi:putative phage-type endonuclease